MAALPPYRPRKHIPSRFSHHSLVTVGASESYAPFGRNSSLARLGDAFYSARQPLCFFLGVSQSCLVLHVRFVPHVTALVMAVSSAMLQVMGSGNRG